MHMSNSLDATRLADLARDPHRHGDAATVAHAALRAAQAERATLNTAGQAINAALRPCFDREAGVYPGLSGDLRRLYDSDYGSYTGHPMDPRNDSSDDESGDMIEQINCAEQALHMARQAIAGSPNNLACARALMTEACGFLEVA